MPDAQIVNSAVASGESEYTLKGGVAFVLKAVYGEFDGSASASAFLPAVLIASDDGQTVALAADQAVQVAAGGSAAVSFFPGSVGGGGSTSSALPSFCVAGGQGTIVPSGGGSETGLDFYNPLTPGPNFATNDSSRFTPDEWTSVTIPAFIGGAGVGVHKTGTYLAMFGVEFDDNPLPHFAGDPSTVQVFAEDNGDYLVAMADVFLGSWYVKGHTEPQTSSRKFWRVQWAQIITVNASTTDAPILIGAMQASGVSLNAHPALYIVELDPTRLFT